MQAETIFADDFEPRAPGSMPVMPYPPLPASPTLTNPDMILPEYERSSSPDRSQSPLHMWKVPLTLADMQYHMPLQNAFPAGPITPTTPIIYGNGTMLSDIGEVTEVESAAGGNSLPASPGRFRLVNRNFAETDVVFRSSPTMGERGIAETTVAKPRRKATTRERSGSIDSTSTVTTAERPNVFGDFDDAVSVGDSSFQGDDEESVAESFADDASVQSARLQPSGNGSGLNEENRFSTSSIGRRAELILANAKRRLTTMEGNLSRARSSLYIHSTLESDGSISAPSPPFASPRGNLSDPNSSSSRIGHSRMPSDNLLSLDTNSSPPNAYPRRSASALGAAGGYRQPLHGSKSLDTLKLSLIRSPRATSLVQGETNLEPLSEDESVGGSGRRTSAQLDGFLSPTFGPNPDRPASAAQMRELKEQMLGLKGKISSLREQARVDSLKRQSLQSLRTPSPFTHARIEQWYSEPQGQDSEQPTEAESEPQTGRDLVGNESASVEEPLDEKDAGFSASAVGIPQSVEEAPGPDLGESPASSTIEAAELNAPTDAAGTSTGEYDIDDMCTEDGIDPIEDAEEGNPSRRPLSGYTSESGESLYHDAQQTPLSHEDREDAFDYEHFFLHSAMGTISQQQFRRRGSMSSEGSVETTRGPLSTAPDGEIKPRHHARRGSGDTTSTTDTFATADEEKENMKAEAEAEEAVALDGTVVADNADPEQDSSEGLGSISYEEYLNGVRARRRHNSVVYRPTRTSMHRPSVSSFESTGTNRSFPLVNGNSKVKMNGGILTPQGSPDQELKNISDTLMNETASIFDKDGADGGCNSGIDSLRREDQLLVQRLVASLGRCVLGLSESGQASPAHRTMRRKLDEARRILEDAAAMTVEE